ncbi:MAG: hypothetical protein H7323_15845, partial [Frankiales bacterium]|nr:hypothetical protein [Frankiales bacterium]
NVITVTMPVALFNSAAKPKTPLGVGKSLAGIAIYSDLGPAAVGVTTPYNAAPIDQAEFFQCVYTLGATAHNA